MTLLDAITYGAFVVFDATIWVHNVFLFIG